MENKVLRITMPDSSKWDVPVIIIANDRANYYKDEFNNDLNESLEKDTLPLFRESDYEIVDWAANNMDWDDVKEFAKQVPDSPKPVDFQEGWLNGEKEVLTL